MSNIGFVSRLFLQKSSIYHLSRVKPLVFEPVVLAPTLICTRGLKIKKDAKGGGAAGKKGAAMVKPTLEVEEDAHKENFFSLLNLIPVNHFIVKLFYSCITSLKKRFLV